MDSLDFNAHSAILTALASSYASAPEVEEPTPVLRDLPAAAHNLSQPGTDATTAPGQSGSPTGSPKQNQGGFLSALGLGGGKGFFGGGRPAKEPISRSQVHHITAYATYASKSAQHHASVQPHVLERLLSLVAALPSWDVEETLSAESPNEYPLVDQLTERLVSAVLDVGATNGNVSARTRIVASLHELLHGVSTGLQRGDPNEVITHYIPMISGFQRAITSSAFPFTTDLFNDLFPSVVKNPLITPSSSFVEQINTICAGKLDSTSDQGPQLDGILSRYDLLAKPLSMGFISHASLQACRVALQQVVVQGVWPPIAGPFTSAAKDGWSNLTSTKGRVGVSRGDESIIGAVERSLQLVEEIMGVVGQLREEEDAQTYVLEIASESLKVATAGCVALDRIDGTLVDVLKALHSENAAAYDPLIQITATECLIVIARNFPNQIPFVSKTLRHYVTSPLPLFESTSDGVPTDALLVAAHGLAASIELVNETDFTTSTMYSLLNHVRSTHAGAAGGGGGKPDSDARSFSSDARSFATGVGGHSRSEEEKRQVAVDAVHVVAAIAVERKDKEITSLAASMLQQRLRGTEPIVETAILSALADLATISEDVQLFEDVVSTFTAVSKTGNAANDKITDAASSDAAVLTAQTRLASKLHSHQRACEYYLTELLKLFVDKGKPAVAGTHGTTSRQTLTHLLNLVPVIGTLLQTNVDFNPRYTESRDLVILFRNFWYLAVLLGFASPKNPNITEWQLSSLRQVAVKTPPLTRGAPLDYLESELEYNSLLRQPEGLAAAGKESDAQKNELAAALPTHAGQIRSLTHAQAVFLLTVLRLETLRAQECRAAPVLEYIQNEGISQSSLFDALSSITDVVLSTFIMAFQQQAIRHSLDKSVYIEIREILVSCTHRSERARSVALRYMQGLVTAFPTVICHYETVATILEILTLCRRACEGQYEDEYSPTWTFESQILDLKVNLSDDYAVREKILKDFHKHGRHWLLIAVNRAPLEMHSILHRYIDGLEQVTPSEQEPEMGRSVAFDLARSVPPTMAAHHLPAWGDWRSDLSTSFANSFAHRNFYSGEADDLKINLSAEKELPSLAVIRSDLRAMTEQATKHPRKVKQHDLRALLYRAGAATLAAKEVDYEVLHRLVIIPVRVFTPAALAAGQEVWTWLVDSRPELEAKLMTDVITMWGWTVRRRRGLFSDSMNSVNPLDLPTAFTPTDREEVTYQGETARKLLAPHARLLDFIASRFQAARYKSRSVVIATLRLVTRSLTSFKHWSTHPLSRELRLKLLTFGFTLLQGHRMEATIEHHVRDLLYDASLSWFEQNPIFAFGNSRAQQEADLRLLHDLEELVGPDSPSHEFFTTSLTTGDAGMKLPGGLTLKQAAARHEDRHHLLRILIENERYRLAVWLNPLNDSKRGKDPQTYLARGTSDNVWRRIVHAAWDYSPLLAVRMTQRLKVNTVKHEVERLVKTHPEKARAVPEALPIFIGEKLDPAQRPLFRHLLYWEKVPVVNALMFFLPQYENDPLILQYGMRVLEEHHVDVTFFYIPQVVQALRTDDLGYMERFISETARVSQLFCHQIIWNMKANTHKDDEGEEPDPMKPQLDRMVDIIVDNLSGEAKDFYEREFSFFDEVTSISRKLMPYLKKSKAEKKAKIAEELAKIKVDQGVYLPSNPDGSVVDIDRNSGRPLQSHAKTPFMATFKVHREKKVHHDEDDEDDETADQTESVDQWQAAIFKVGDDCRQDVLALQLIAMAKNVYESVSLDVHLVPYRVTATAPGCGVIDVIPNATSRDEMGRAQINNLKTFFLGKFGAEDSETFQRARIAFIRSMAAYSVLCHLLQIRDRHNGNIMIDGDGHITHIDFGFLFDIGPGGVHFEAPSFKLTLEMINVMGGFKSPGYRQFQELVVKAYLAARPYSKEIVNACKLMESTGLPSYTGEGTMIRLADRFKVDMNEREAAVHMQKLIDNAEVSNRNTFYDEFQLKTNAIPYAR